MSQLKERTVGFMFGVKVLKPKSAKSSMFPASYQKFYSVLMISLVLGFGAMSFMYGDVTTTGFVVSESTPTEFPLSVFIFGMFIGMFVVGMLLTVLHFEHRRI